MKSNVKVMNSSQYLTVTTIRSLGLEIFCSLKCSTQRLYVSFQETESERIDLCLLNISTLFDFLVAIAASCGYRPGQSRIVGGTTAAQGSWSWQLSLRYSGGHSCGASLT